MVRRKPAPPAHKVVWRISASAPMGEFVDLSAVQVAAPKREAAAPDAGSEAGWGNSTHDLLSGMGVSEAPMDTLPGELIDEFFRPKR